MNLLSAPVHWRAAGEALGLPLEANPQLAVEPRALVQIAVW
jgi:hypothetical protein